MAISKANSGLSANSETMANSEAMASSATMASNATMASSATMPCRLSVSNLAWAPEQNEAIAALLSSHKVHLIDIAPGKFLKGAALTDLATIKRERAWWYERGFSFAGMQSLLFGTQGLNVFGPAEVQAHMLKHLEHICILAAELELKPLVFGSPKNRDRSGLSDAAAEAIALDFFNRLGEIAQKHGVIICLEPNAPQYGTNFLVTTAEACAFITQLNNPAIKLQIDTGTFWANHEDPAVLAQALRYAGHVHFSEPGLKPLGSKVASSSYQELAAYLSPWEQPVTIEMLTSSPEAAGAEITQAITLMQQVLASKPKAGEPHEA